VLERKPEATKSFGGVTSHRCASVRERERECERGEGVAAPAPGLTVGGVTGSAAHPRVASTPPLHPRHIMFMG